MQETENSLDITSIKELKSLSDDEVLKIVSECRGKKKKERWKGKHY